jgi:hypothetical protein
MVRVCENLTRSGIDLTKFTALEFFAREGDWQTKSYASKVRELHAWEIDPAYELKLKENLPNAFIRIGDSYKISQEKCYKKRFDFIVFDNPQNIFGDYCEHFEALLLVKKLLGSEGVVIFNVNLAPFDYDKYPLWKKRRSNFYARDASKLDSFFLLNFYKAFFESEKFEIQLKFEEKRNNDYLSYRVYYLKRIK